MPTLLTATGRDVLFAHWPVAPGDVAPVVPAPLEPATFDGTAWVSALAIRESAVVPGPIAPPPALRARVGTPQLNLRTYVTFEGETGVYFLSLDSGTRLAAALGRLASGLPVRRARARATRRDGTVEFRSRRPGDPPAAFAARYRPRGAASPADPGTLADFCVERDTYFLPAAEDRRPGGDDGGVRVGRITREPWRLRPVEADVRVERLLGVAGLPAPAAEPTLGYSDGFEMGVEPVETVDPGDRGGHPSGRAGTPTSAGSEPRVTGRE